MVRHFPFVFAALVLSLLSCSAQTSPPAPARIEVPKYDIGDTAKADVVATVPLVVVDAEKTAALKEAESARVPVIYRFWTNAAAQTEENLRTAFETTRSNYLDRLQTAFNRSRLSEANIASAKFQRITATFQRQSKSFPVSTNLAEMWARGDLGRVKLSSYAAVIHEASLAPMRTIASPADIKPGVNVRLIPVGDVSAPLTLADVDERGKNTPRALLVTVAHTREDLLQSLPAEDRPVAKFLGSLLRTNCVLDAELTRAARARRTDALYSAERYEAGQLIVKAGQTVDKPIKAALDQLREKTAADSLVKLQVAEEVRDQVTSQRNQVIVAGSVCVLLVLGVVIWRLARRKPAPSLLPVPVGHGELSGAAYGFGDNPSGFRAWLAPHLAKVLTDKMVRRLLTQRSDLIESHQRAAAEMAELEARLEQMHAPLADRLRAYEQRISELEKELTRKGEENKELLRAKILLTRQQLESIRSKAAVNLN